jgi:hypothetical protein
MQQYKLVVRQIWVGPTQLESSQIVVQNALEFESHLNNILKTEGYTVHEVVLLRTTPPTNPLDFPKYEFAYHLVKELNTFSKEK